MALSYIQPRITSLLNPERIASYDQEMDEAATQTLIHSAARLLYIREGKGTIEINGVSYPLQPHTLVSIQPWTVTTITEVEDPIFYDRIIYNLSYINLYVRSDYNPSAFFYDFWQEMKLMPVQVMEGELRDQVENCLDRIRRELGMESFLWEEKQEAFSDMHTISLLVELFTFYNRGLLRLEKPDPPEESFNISQLLNYLYSHLQEKITLDRLEKTFYISQSTISKKLNSSLGYSFQELLSAMRIAKAMDLLAFTDFSLNEVAELVGFTDGAHLTRAFESSEGMTPTEFRHTAHAKEKRRGRLRSDEASLSLKILNQILNTYQSPDLQPRAIAESYGISLAELNRITLFYVERSASDFIAWLRISRASEYLLRTQLSVDEISERVGFKNSKTFYRHFSRHFGMTPGQFRERVRFQTESGEVLEPGKGSEE